MVFSYLDSAARANLSGYHLTDYFNYKNQLIKDGHASDDMRDILSGFIWDRAELQNEETDEL